MMPSHYQTLKINSSVNNIYLVERLIDNVCDEFKLTEDSYGNILIAVTEAVNNAIHHGNLNNPEKFVNINFESDSKKLIFAISDEGKGFDQSTLPDPTDPTNISKPSGRGVFLMKNLSDAIKFEENGKKVLLEFNF